jgi:catechol 2,3-dioxygenase-like lactoylglutathione lyase family enzyme
MSPLVTRSNRMTRRESLALIGAGVLAARRAAADQPFRFTTLDHVEMTVADVQKSALFYARIFGNTVLKNNKTTRRYVKLGPCFLAMDQNQRIGVDHFSAGIEGYDIEKIHAYLKQQGVEYRDFPSGKDLNVTDPDGIRLQLSVDNSWKDLVGGTASPENISIPGEPIFKPTGYDHILLNVTDPEKSEKFYEKVLGPVTQRNNNRTWFQIGKSRIGLLKTPAGQKAGVNHFCVSAASVDYDRDMKKLEQLGAKLEPAEVPGAPEFRDLDGYLVQVNVPGANNGKRKK